MEMQETYPNSVLKELVNSLNFRASIVCLLAYQLVLLLPQLKLCWLQHTAGGLSGQSCTATLDAASMQLGQCNPSCNESVTCARGKLETAER
jgi:hypothetical protein